MTEITVPKSLTEQILDEMFTDIEKHQEIGTQMIEYLRLLAQNGDLKKSQQVIQAIKSMQRSKP